VQLDKPGVLAAVGARLHGLGVGGPAVARVLVRVAQGRAQQRLEDYRICARELGATDREAGLVLAAVERTASLAAVGRVDVVAIAVEILLDRIAGRPA